MACEEKQRRDDSGHLLPSPFLQVVPPDSNMLELILTGDVNDCYSVQLFPRRWLLNREQGMNGGRWISGFSRGRHERRISVTDLLGVERLSVCS